MSGRIGISTYAANINCTYIANVSLNMIDIVFALLNTPVTRVVLTVSSCKHIIKVNYQNNELFTIIGVNIC